MISCHTPKQVETVSSAAPRENTKYNKMPKHGPGEVITKTSTTDRTVSNRKGTTMDRYALKLGVSKDELMNAGLYKLVDDWYATPYLWGGKTKAGIDCSDFAELVLDKIYGVHITGPVTNIFKQCVVIKKTDLIEGDLVFFSISGPLSHVGIYLCNNKFVHASTRAGVVIEDLNMDYYKRYFYKAGRIKRS